MAFTGGTALGYLSEFSGVLSAEAARTRAAVHGGKAFSQIPDIAEVAAPTGAAGALLLGESTNFSQGFAHFRYHVYTIVSHIAQRVAGQPINVGEVTGSDGAGRKRYLPGHVKAGTLPSGVRAASRLLASEDLAVINDGPLVEALERPNAIQSKNDFAYCLIANLLMTGEAYIIGGLTRRDGVPELWAVPVRWIIPKHEGRLFSGYTLKTSPNKDGIPLPPECVARIYLPDPTDPKACISPVFTQLRSVHIDEQIQASQEKAFENSIFPTLALHVGRIGGKDKAPRKLLQPHQRRQLISAVRKIYGGVARSGEPMILDALIENVSPITHAPREMDWNISAEAVKKRLYHAFGLNPVATGEITGVNKAQALVAERHQAVNVLNPLLEKLSCMLNSFVVPMFMDDPRVLARTVAWFEPARADDEELQAKEYEAGAKLGYVSKNEYRRRLGLDPVEGDQSALLANPATLAAVTNLIRTVGEGIVPESAAALLLVKALGIEDEEALALVRGAGVSSVQQAERGIAKLRAIKAAGLTREAVLEHRQGVADAAEMEVAAFLQQFFPGRLQLEHRRNEASRAMNPGSLNPAPLTRLP